MREESGSSVSMCYALSKSPWVLFRVPMGTLLQNLLDNIRKSMGTGRDNKDEWMMDRMVESLSRHPRLSRILFRVSQIYYFPSPFVLFALIFEK